jgi:hypothetical protein
MIIQKCIISQHNNEVKGMWPFVLGDLCSYLSHWFNVFLQTKNERSLEIFVLTWLDSLLRLLLFAQLLIWTVALWSMIVTFYSINSCARRDGEMSMNATSFKHLISVRNWSVSLIKLWQMKYCKKKLDLLGIWRPKPFCKREDLLTQVEKTPEPLPHSYTGTSNPCEATDGLATTATTQVGGSKPTTAMPWARPGLDLCLGYGDKWGDFFDTSLLPLRVEPRSWGVVLRSSN